MNNNGFEVCTLFLFIHICMYVFLNCIYLHICIYIVMYRICKYINTHTDSVYVHNIVYIHIVRIDARLSLFVCFL